MKPVPPNAKDDAPPPQRPTHPPKPVDLAKESVAGEEDPGAAIESLVDPKVNPPPPAPPSAR